MNKTSEDFHETAKKLIVACDQSGSVEIPLCFAQNTDLMTRDKMRDEQNSWDECDADKHTEFKGPYFLWWDGGFEAIDSIKDLETWLKENLEA